MLLSLFFFNISFEYKTYTSITFNEDISNYGNRKSDLFIVQIESLLAEKEGFGACAPFSDKQWVSTIYPFGKSQASFSPFSSLFFLQKKEMQCCISFFWRRKRDSNPRYVYHILLPQQGSPLSLLGISPRLLKFFNLYLILA